MDWQTDNWRDFVIKRITIFRGRTAGSLTQSEVKALRSWLPKVVAGWTNVDKEIKAHFGAIMCRAQELGIEL